MIGFEKQFVVAGALRERDEFAPPFAAPRRRWGVIFNKVGEK